MDSTKTISEIKSARENSEKIYNTLKSIENGVWDNTDFKKISSDIQLLNEQVKEISSNFGETIAKLHKVKTIIEGNSKKYRFMITLHNDGVHMMINSRNLFAEKHHMYLLVNDSNELYDMIFDADEKLLKLVNDASIEVFEKAPATFQQKLGQH